MYATHTIQRSLGGLQQFNYSKKDKTIKVQLKYIVQPAFITLVEYSTHVGKCGTSFGEVLELAGFSLGAYEYKVCAVQ